MRGSDGRVAVCMIRQHCVTAGSVAYFVATFLMVSRANGLILMLKHSTLDRPEGQPVEGAFAIDGKPFFGFKSRMLGYDEVGIFPKAGKMEFPIPAGVVPWLRACSRRWNRSQTRPV